MNSKKHLILYVLKILESNTDEKHPMRQKEIVDIISSAVPCDRKTVARNIKFLQEMGDPIEKNKKGYFIKQKRFSLLEVEFLKSAIQSAPETKGVNKDKLTEKLSITLNKILEYEE